MGRSRRGLRAAVVGCVVAASLATVAVDPPTVAADPPTAAADPPVAGVVSLAEGNRHTCALRANGSVKCWGTNYDGQLGLGDTADRGFEAGQMGASLPTVDLGTGRTAVAIAGSGGDHTCALLDNGQVKCWGANDWGTLGVGDTEHRGDQPGEMGDDLPAVDLGTGRTAVAVSAGSYKSCALLDDGSVKCWGSGNVGRLGLGDFEDRGDEPGEMGDALPVVNLGTGRTATSLVAGSAHSCAILDNASLKCWGYNGTGELGLGDISLRGGSPSQMGDNLPAVDLGTGRSAIQVDVGGGYTCALLDDATVKCWGFGSWGTLGAGDTQIRGDQPGEMGDALPVVDLGSGPTVTSINAGSTFTCALLDTAAVKCWGRNSQGSLGLGDTLTRGDQPGEMGDNLPAVDLGTGRTASVIAVATDHACALLDDHSVKCWGQKNWLGLGGSGGTRGDQPGEMGDSLPIVVLDASPTVAVTAAEASVVAGEPINLEVTVANPGDGALSDVVVDGGDATGCDTVIPLLGPGAQQVIDCVQPTSGMDLPSFTTTATASATHAPNPVVSVPLEVPVVLSPSVGAIGGIITGTGTGTPIAGGLVALLSPVDFSLVGFAAARANGTYSTIAAPGSYFVYALNPAGAHLPGFVGAPTQVVVAGGSTTAVNPMLTSATGEFAGTVTATGSGAPVADVVVASLDSATGAPDVGALTDGSGGYTVGPLPTGPRYAIFADLSGAHVPEFYDNSAGILGADSVSVSGGITLGVDAVLDPSTPPAGGATIAGTVTDDGSAAALPGAVVFALDASDLGLATGAVTDSNGEYELDLDPGDYKLQFYPPSGSHLVEWHDGLPFTAIGSADPVTATAGSPVTVDAALDQATGSAAGTVVEDGTGTPLAGIWVVAVSAAGKLRIATTDASGEWALNGLGLGGHLVRFVDPTGAHAAEFYDDQAGPDDSTPVVVASAQTTSVAAGLAPSP